MEDVVNASDRLSHAVNIAHISNVELDPLVREEMTHVVLLLFVSRKDSNLADVEL
jgi:hypothetical protein